MMRIMVSCGEVSGDVYAGALVTELRRRVPAAEIFGLGGEKFAAAGGQLVGEFAGLTVTGITEILRVLPQSFAMLRRLVAEARARRPDVFVAIDFPDFNFRLSAAMARLGIPVVYYVSPQLWAWRSGRVNAMKRFVDEVLVIFPFETAVYERAGVPVTFVGHPLIDLVRASESRETFLGSRGLAADVPTVALLPGSRPNELRRIAPTLAAAIPLIRDRVPTAQFVVARAPNLPDSLYGAFAGSAWHGSMTRGDALGTDVGDRSGAPVLVSGRTDDVLASCDVVICASGTATVQAALHERPMVVVYRLSTLTYWVGKPFVHVDMYAMPNLVAGERVVPELIQEGFTPESVARETVALLADSARYRRVRDALGRFRERLGAPGASARAADAVLAIAADPRSRATAVGRPSG